MRAWLGKTRDNTVLSIINNDEWAKIAYDLNRSKAQKYKPLFNKHELAKEVMIGSLNKIFKHFLFAEFYLSLNHGFPKIFLEHFSINNQSLNKPTGAVPRRTTQKILKPTQTRLGRLSPKL